MLVSSWHNDLGYRGIKRCNFWKKRRYEKKSQPLLPLDKFIKRAASHFGVIVFLFALSLGVGVVGYHWYEGYSWLDSLLNAAMILSGMGLVDKPITDSGKVFVSLYALFSGILFIASAGIFLLPFTHRILHFFHLQSQDDLQ